jgi:opacity protein-like surface antigen
MRKALFTALFFVFCAPLAFAQGDFQRGEFGIMYSHNLVDTDGAFSNDPNDTGRDGFNGVNIDAGYNFSRYVGAKVDFSYHKKSADIGFITAPPGTGGTVNIDGKLTQFMGGVKLQDNATETKVRPFAQLLLGVGRVEIEASGTGIPAGLNQSETGFAAAVGGGLDIRVHRNVDIRAIKVEYNPVRIEGQTDNNIRLGVGLNFRF